MVYTPIAFPDDGSVTRVLEPWVMARIILPVDYISPLMPLLYEHEAEVMETINFGSGKKRNFNDNAIARIMRGFLIN